MTKVRSCFSNKRMILKFTFIRIIVIVTKDDFVLRQSSVRRTINYEFGLRLILCTFNKDDIG